MDDLQRAIRLLKEDQYTCVLCMGEALHVSRQRGVRPLLELAGRDFSGYAAADKVVGKATALLYCHLHIRQLHACVISDAALEVLQVHGIHATWDRRVPYIRNRAGDGRCPMELATQDISDPRDALVAIRKKLEELQS